MHISVSFGGALADSAVALVYSFPPPGGQFDTIVCDTHPRARVRICLEPALKIWKSHHLGRTLNIWKATATALYSLFWILLHG